ncbi:MAG: hypothetical protein CL920_24960 [Deltaproteobacteria bacterium]|nr:hypothetical protein [Deltaproteobacteria bacterium]MBU51955.1 hypothetical protein [Deltaproteobacteria bacterium]|tara:strand:- start:179 stop:376 length:198 start_codon:yes stop_codon:yes gene_type:complete
MLKSLYEILVLLLHEIHRLKRENEKLRNELKLEQWNSDILLKEKDEILLQFEEHKKIQGHKTFDV